MNDRFKVKDSIYTRQLHQENLDVFLRKDRLYKQHILPSLQNLALLKNTKKVVLLRNPYDIILAYRRGIIRSIHGEKKGFDSNLSEVEWIETANRNGLLKVLSWFYGLNVTTKRIKLSRKRYSRHSGINTAAVNLRRRMMRFVLNHNYYERLKKIQTYLRNHGISWG